jgi:hypothetical protein
MRDLVDMRIIQIFVILMSVFTACPLLALDITGPWDVTFLWGTACRWEGTLNFVQSGNPGSLSGSGEHIVTEGGCGGSSGPINGSINGTTVAFLYPEGELAEAQLDGTISGDAISGTWINISTSLSGAWTAVKTTPVPPVTLRVPSEFNSVQDAIDSAVDGDTVLIAPGTYFEKINFVGKA